MVYILEITPPLHHARYYVGFCQDNRFDLRLEYHRKGLGAKLTNAAIHAGCQLIPVAVLPHADRNTERKIKRMKNTPRKVKSILKNPREWIISNT